ncbi:MAG: RNA polymerase sigma factor [Candidatus Pacebacteria bacterium]|nr:RNA polymerase sigma factor [Candidatus Paceibacterota bacterium]
MASRANKKFAKIYDKHIDKIYRFVFLKTGSKELAEDLTSQVFTKGWKKFKLQGAEIKNMSAYLFQIARAEVASHYRESSKFQIISAESVEIADEKEDLEISQDIGLTGQGVQAVLKQLEEELQNILIWHYVEGLSFKEIGEFLGRPEGTARVMAHRALKELREAMEKSR